MNNQRIKKMVRMNGDTISEDNLTTFLPDDDGNTSEDATLSELNMFESTIQPAERKEQPQNKVFKTIHEIYSFWGEYIIANDIGKMAAKKHE